MFAFGLQRECADGSATRGVIRLLEGSDARLNITVRQVSFTVS